MQNKKTLPPFLGGRLFGATPIYYLRGWCGYSCSLQSRRGLQDCQGWRSKPKTQLKLGGRSDGSQLRRYALLLMGWFDLCVGSPGLIKKPLVDPGLTIYVAPICVLLLSVFQECPNSEGIIWLLQSTHRSNCWWLLLTARVAQAPSSPYEGRGPSMSCPAASRCRSPTWRVA